LEVIFQSAGLGPIFVMSQEGWWTEKLAGEIFIYEHVIIKGEKISEVVECFPI